MIRMERDVAFDLVSVLSKSSVGHYAGALGTLETFLARSVEVWCGQVDGEPACVVGLIGPTILSDRAYLWMLHTDAVDRHRFLFIRHSQLWMEQMLHRYAEIYGEVEAKNARAIRWLKWLGAELGVAQGPLIPFVIKAKPHG